MYTNIDPGVWSGVHTLLRAVCNIDTLCWGEPLVCVYRGRFMEVPSTFSLKFSGSMIEVLQYYLRPSAYDRWYTTYSYVFHRAVET